MSNKKTVAVYVNRKITLNREGHEPVVFLPGQANHVDADAAGHGFVKAHTVQAIDTAAQDAELAAAIARAERAENDADKSDAALEVAIVRAETAETERDAALAKVAELEKAIASMVDDASKKAKK